MSGRILRFGVFEADLDARELRKHGLRVKLQDQPFQVLCALLERPGTLVPREELRERLWADDTFVDFDNGLNTAIQKLRETLNDSARSPRFVETVPRRGYKFIAPVESVPSGVSENADLSQSPNTPVWELMSSILLLLVGAYLVMPREPPNSTFNRPPISFSIRPPEGDRFLPVYWGGGVVPSPDGKRLVYAVQAPDGTQHLVLRELRATAAKMLPGTDGARFPFWSPDSGSIGFWADGRLVTLRLDTGMVHHVAEAPLFRGGSWSTGDDGVIVFAADINQPLFWVPASGGSPEPVTALREEEVDHGWPYFLPDQRRFLYFARMKGGARAAIRVGSLDPEDAAALGSEPLLNADSGARFVPDPDGTAGWLLCVVDRALTAQRFDAQNLGLLGEAATVAQGIEPGFIGSGNYNFAPSANGVLAYRSRPSSFGTNQLTWFDREGKRLGVLGQPASHLYVSLSPDGRRVAVTSTTRDDGARNVDIWVYDNPRGAPLRRTFHPDLDRTPVWSPDSKTILFCSNRESPSRMYRITAMGADDPIPFLEYADGENARDWPSDWSAANGLVMFSRHNGVDLDIWSARPDDPSSAVAIIEEPERQLNAKLSPDGRALVYASAAAGEAVEVNIYLQPYPPTGEKFRVSTAGGNQPLWRGDSRELYYLSPEGALMAVEVKMGPPIELSVPRTLFQTAAPFSPAPQAYQYAVSSDGQRFLVMTELNSPPATVVVNWQGLLKKK